MIKIVTVEEMRAIEKETDASGLTYDQMMDNAGRALADRVLTVLADQPSARITVLVGPGNNGGDALVAGRLIAEDSDHEVSFYLYKPRESNDRVFAPVQEGGYFVAQAPDDQRYRVLRNLLSTSHLIIDGLLGIGLRLPIEGGLADFMETVRKGIERARQSPAPASYLSPATPASASAIGPMVIAVDCPSGLDCNSGAVDDLVLAADETVTFGAAKTGQVLFPGAGTVGRLHVADVGAPNKITRHIKLEMPTPADVRDQLPALPADAHKGTFGKTMIVAGSLNYTGAAGMAATAAYRVGAGLVTVGAPQPIIPVLAASLPEATWLLLPHDMGVIAENAAEVLEKEISGYNALLMGPGWGQEDTTRAFLQAILNSETPQHGKRSIGFVPSTASGETAEDTANTHRLPPLVVDADGLNLLSGIDDWWDLLPPNTILTPHPGEMARLTGLSREEVQATRLSVAGEKAKAWNCVVLLKGAHSVIAAPDGQCAVLPFAVPALATAGTGDVLAGAIAGLLGQGLAPFEAAMVAGYLHGLAGQFAAETRQTARSVTATDVLAHLPAAVAAVEKSA